MMRQSEFKKKLDPELGKYTRQHIYGEGMTDVFNPLPPKGLMRCMTPLPQGPMAKMRVI